MHIIFTEEELEYIDRKPFNWEITDDCPQGLANSIEEKLSLLRRQEKVIGSRVKKENNNGRA